MGGTNQGPRPSEYVLAALAACQEVTYRLYADALDIPLMNAHFLNQAFVNHNRHVPVLTTAIAK